MQVNKSTKAGERTRTTKAIDGHLYAYTNSIIANDNFKCRGMVPVDALQFWASHYTSSDATSERSRKPATTVVFFAEYMGDQLTPEEAHGVLAEYRYSPKAGFSPALNSKIAVGDLIQASSRTSPGWRGVVKGIEMVRLFRGSERTPRYHVTDGDHQWTVDHKDVVFRYAGCDPKDLNAVRELCA